MVNTILPIPLSSSSQNSASSSSKVFGSKTATNNTDFSKILLAQMSNPDLGALFSSNENGTSSSVGNSFNDLVSNTNAMMGLAGTGSANASSGLFGQTSNSTELELTLWGNMIGKNIEALDRSTGETKKGKVNSVMMQDGAVVLDVDGALIAPAAIIKIQN